PTTSRPSRAPRRWSGREDDGPDRGRRLPRLESRHRCDQRPGGRRRRAGRPLARPGEPRWCRRSAGPGRLRVRRLPPRRRDRPVQPDRPRRDGVRRWWRPRPRDLQWLPGPDGGPPAARCAAPEPGAALRLAGDRDRSGAPGHAIHQRPRPAAAAADAGRPRRRRVLRRRGHPGRAGAGRPGALPLRRPGHRRRRRRGRGPGEPERLAPGDRRGDERRRQRGGPDAASRDRRRGGAWIRRRPRDHRLVRGERRRPRAVQRTRARGRSMTLAEPPVAVEEEPLHRRLGVTDEELAAIRDRLGGRDPNDLELAMFSVMWSEHCSYKSSRPLLRTLPTAATGDELLAGPGENAGVVSIGGGLAVAFKIESHNHPSAVEPYQGAATGVGGILRDIFTMGARPIAVLDALRFGDPGDPRTRHLVEGVVKGVGGYGNCVGVPTVGGELVFDPSYQGNPLVNVMAIGLLEERLLTLASAPGPGNLVVLFGSATGRDGIGGASVLASSTFTDADVSKRPSVQVGDPFAEKLLIEASLELIAGGLVEGLQDLGAGGISCATSETADRAGTGIVIDLDAIPRREPGLEPFEVMIS